MGIGISIYRISQKEAQYLFKNQQYTLFIIGHLNKMSIKFDDFEYNQAVERGILFDSIYWDGIYYLLTGNLTIPSGVDSLELRQDQLDNQSERKLHSNSVYDLIFNGGKRLLKENSSRSIRLLELDDIIKICEAMRLDTPAKVKKKFNKSSHKNVYIYKLGDPNYWDNEDMDQILICYSDLRKFFFKTAENKDSLIIYFS